MAKWSEEGFELGLPVVPSRSPLPLLGERLRSGLDSGYIRIFTAAVWLTFSLDFLGFRAANFLIPLFLFLFFFPFELLKGSLGSLSHYLTPLYSARGCPEMVKSRTFHKTSAFPHAVVV